MNRRWYGCVWALAAAACSATAVAAVVRVQAQEGRGKQVYDTHCVECHGRSGRGDGPSAAFLTPRPRDFTTGKYKIRTTETGTPPTDDDLIHSVKRGLYASAMPGWDRILDEEDIVAVVQ